MGMRLWAPAMIVVAAACASSAPAANPPDRVLATANEGVIRSRADIAGAAGIEATADAVFNVLPDVYKELGVEVKLIDLGTRSVGNKRFSKMYRFGNQGLDAYFGCGLTPTGPIANSDRLTISAVSTVVPAGKLSQLQTIVTAYAEDLSLNKGKMSCMTTGKFEEQVIELVQQRLRTQ